MIWNEKAECMSVQEREELQLNRLQEVVKKPMIMCPIIIIDLTSEEDIQNLEDIEKLPFTSKNDLRTPTPLACSQFQVMILWKFTHPLEQLESQLFLDTRKKTLTSGAKLWSGT